MLTKIETIIAREKAFLAKFEPGTSQHSLLANRIAEMTGINRNTLYKWNCGAMRFSPDNIDRLLLYFQEHEPERLDRAEKVYDALRGIE